MALLGPGQRLEPVGDLPEALVRLGNYYQVLVIDNRCGLPDRQWPESSRDLDQNGQVTTFNQMTGSNRLRIGIGWSLVVGLAWVQWRKGGKGGMADREIVLDRVHFAEALTAWTIAKRRRNFGRLLVDGSRAPYNELVP